MTTPMQARHPARTWKPVALLAAAFLGLAASQAYAGTTTYKYDTLGRVVEVDYPDGSIVTYTYDKAGNRTATTRHAGP